jgi:hypothetical protein
VDPARIAAARAVAARVASACGLEVSASEDLQVSNRVVVRLLPCDVVARVADAGERDAATRELALADALLRVSAPIAGPDARVPATVHIDDGFVVSLWTHHPPVPPRELDPAAHAAVLAQLHASMRLVSGVDAPHFTERVARARTLMSSTVSVPAIGEDDRAFVLSVLDSSLASVLAFDAPEQLLHGEPHGGNVLRTASGLLFTDFEAACVGPVEFDVADVDEAVAAQYPNLDASLHRSCQRLVQAMVATWCWAGYDDHDNLRHFAHVLLEELRRAQ